MLPSNSLAQPDKEPPVGHPAAGLRERGEWWKNNGLFRSMQILGVFVWEWRNRYFNKNVHTMSIATTWA
jgi:hypothetical protein